jgi:hypothetical protein
MGHSDAWRDAEWLAEQILLWMFAQERPSEIIHFSLLGSQQDVALLVGPVGGGEGDRSLALTFSVRQRNEALDSGPSDPVSLLRAAMHDDRYLLVLQRANGARLQKPKALRREIRKMLVSARELEEGQPCPILAQHLHLPVAKDSLVDDLTKQIVVIFSQWGLIEMTEGDRQAFVKYLLSLFPHPDRFVLAAEEAISYIFSNWVFPEDRRAFKQYAKHTVWGLYAQEARAVSEMKHSPPGGAIQASEDWAEQEVERTKLCKKAAEASRDFISVFELARISKVSPQRIYEMIRANKLKAVKMGMSLRVEMSAAREFYMQAKQRREIQNLKDQLLAKGIPKETLRKRIYRHSLKHGLDTNIVEHLELERNFLDCLLRRSNSGGR